MIMKCLVGMPLEADSRGRDAQVSSCCCSVAKSCPTLCDPVDYSLPGSSVHGILQARILEWLAISSPGDLPNPGIEPRSPAFRADCLPSKPPGTHPLKSVDPKKKKNLIKISHLVMYDFVNPWTVAHQLPLSMEFSRQEWTAISWVQILAQPPSLPVGTHIIWEPQFPHLKTGVPYLT